MLPYLFVNLIKLEHITKVLIINVTFNIKTHFEVYFNKKQFIIEINKLIEFSGVIPIDSEQSGCADMVVMQEFDIGTFTSLNLYKNHVTIVEPGSLSHTV